MSLSFASHAMLLSLGEGLLVILELEITRYILDEAIIWAPGPFVRRTTASLGKIDRARSTESIG